MKVADGEGESLGECVIPLSQFLSQDDVEMANNTTNTIKLSCGGRVTGEISGVFMMTQLIHSASAQDTDHGSGVDV